MKIIGSEAFFAEAGLGFAIFFLGLSGDAVHGLRRAYHRGEAATFAEALWSKDLQRMA
jgi:hypothetical protein